MLGVIDRMLPLDGMTGEVSVAQVQADEISSVAKA